MTQIIKRKSWDYNDRNLFRCKRSFKLARQMIFCVFEFQIDGPAMDLSLRSLATDISQRVVQYYRDNKTSLFENETKNLDWRRHFFYSFDSISRIIMGEITLFLKPATEKEREKEREREKKKYIYDTLS